jgi:hypothetical protein
VLALMSRRPARRGIWSGWHTLGSLSVDQVYVYPPRVFTLTAVNPMTTEEISQEIVRLMNRGAAVRQSCRVALKDGTSFEGAPFSLQIGGPNTMTSQFIADGEIIPRVVRLDEIASIT